MSERMLRELVDRVRDGTLARREFIARMVALGVGVPLASAMLADIAVAQGGDEAPYKPTKRGGGGPLRLLLWQGPTLLNPHFAAGTKDQEGCRPFYESLARYDADGVLLPVLAAEIPSRANGGIAPDGLSTTWRLRKNVTWHDGQPFTADDVVFNWQYATDPAAGAFSIGNFTNVRSVEKIDAATVRINFAKPTPIWDRAAANVWMIPKHLFSGYMGAKSREAPANQHPVGTGPYKFVSFTPGDLVRGEANMAYYLPNRPFFDTIEIKGGGDATSAARAVLQTDEFDYAWNLQVEDNVLKTMEAGGKGRVVFKPSGNPEMIMLNAADPWTEVDGERASVKSKHFAFSDPAVRKAFGLLVDRRSIGDFVYGRAATVSANVLNNPPQYTSKAIASEFNVDKANALLDAAGWTRGADGVRVKDGKRLKLVFQTSTNSVRQKVQAIIKQACAKAGIELELKTVQASVYFSSDLANPDTYGKFFADIEMYLTTRFGTDPDRFMQQWVSWEICQKANGWQLQNKCRWSSPEYDRLFRLSEGELDPVKRAALMVQMNDIACNAGHVVPIAVRAQVTALAKSISAPLTGWGLDLSAIHEWFRV